MAFVYHAVCFKKYIKCSLAQTSFTADGEKEEQFNGSPPRPQPRGPRTPPGPPPPDDDEDEPMPVSGSQEEKLWILLIYVLMSKFGNQIYNAQNIFGFLTECFACCIGLRIFFPTYST